MKVCIIQPKYSTDFSESDECFECQLELLEKCDDSIDLIVLPEAADVPALAHTKEQFEASVKKYNNKLLKVVSDTAKRCNAVVFVNAYHPFNNNFRNTTHAFNRNGEVVGRYYKEQLTPGEIYNRKLDSGYVFEHTAPTVVEIDGLRYGFLTCYDFYFYENYANLARYNLDFIIGCSHQRSDTHSAIEIMSRFLAYNTNTYVVRSSVSMDENADIGGGSMVVAPNGDVLVNLKSKVGMASVDIDPKKKYFKPAGFGGELAAHYEYIEKGRRPWKYRPAGSAITLNDDVMPYPRVCAHRGFNTIAPENSLAAFGAAVGMGAQEIEFDLWYTKDGEIVSIHDKTLDRVSNGTGLVYDYTYEQLLQFDFGAKSGDAFEGIKIIKFEEILKKFACHTIMNIHIKTVNNTCEYDKDLMQKIVNLIKKYDCEKYVYFMSGNSNVLKLAKQLAPDICRCCGAGDDKWSIVERAIELDCKKVQLFKPYFNQQMIDKAHAHGIICNVFFADDVNLAKEYLDMGIDTILTNDYGRIANAVKSYINKGK